MTEPVMVNGKPNPTGTGRYCAPARCYCGDCPGFIGQKTASDRQYKLELRKALRR